MTTAAAQISTTDRIATGGEARGPGDTGHSILRVTFRDGTSRTERIR